MEVSPSYQQLTILALLCAIVVMFIIMISLKVLERCDGTHRELSRSVSRVAHKAEKLAKTAGRISSQLESVRGVVVSLNHELMKKSKMDLDPHYEHLVFDDLPRGLVPVPAKRTQNTQVRIDFKIRELV